jgi:hypothetical protein
MERLITAALIRIGRSKLPERQRKELNLWPGATYFDAIAAALVRAAVKGNAEAAREIWARVEGPTPRRIELTGPDGGPIAIGDAVKKLFEKFAV